MTATPSLPPSLAPIEGVGVASIRRFAQLVDQLCADEEDSVNTLHLTANENILSMLATRFMSGSLYGRYHLGHANKRDFTRCATRFIGLVFKSLPAVYEIEQEALRASAHLFGANYSDFRPLSGVHAIISTLAALTSVNDTIYCLRPNEGGHFATTEIIRRLGRRFRYLPWDNETSGLDLNQVERAFAQAPPKCIYLDHSTSLFPLDLPKLRTLSGDDTLIIYDGSHPLGLIAGGVFANPLTLGADVLQGNTHKTFPGPQKGMILTNSRQLSERLRDTLNNFVSNQHSGDTLALYITILEMEAFGEAYAHQVVRNARQLSRCLSDKGFEVFQHNNTATCSHQVIVLGFEPGDNVASAYKLLSCGISVNSKIALGRHVLRVGVQEATRKGMREQEMDAIAELFFRALKKKDDSNLVKRDVVEFARQFNTAGFCFDNAIGM